jgi:hypothetical protein
MRTTRIRAACVTSRETEIGRDVFHDGFAFLRGVPFDLKRSGSEAEAKRKRSAAVAAVAWPGGGGTQATRKKDA